jgi:LysR family hydrogen peroxide-inducible transcriptional activator
MITLQQMTYILAVADMGQFQKASEFCNVTQPTLSMQVKKAEDMLGHRIFDRSLSTIQLTSFGEQLIPVLRDVISENMKVSQLLKRHSGKGEEVLRIGVIPTIARYLVPVIFEGNVKSDFVFGCHFVEGYTSDLIVKLQKRELDLVIAAGPYVQPGYTSVKLYDEELNVYLSEAFSRSYEKIIPVKVLQSLRPWLLSEGNCLRSQMISFCKMKEEDGLTKWDYNGGNLEVLMHIVEQEGGYTIIPEYYPVSDPGRIFSVDITDSGHYPGRSVIAVHHSRAVNTNLFNELIHFIQHSISRSSAKPLNIIGWTGE